jgi:uncharacterized protein YlxP (DUF503 family)
VAGESGFVAVLVVHLHFPDSGSLKGKRKELSSIKAQLHGRLGAAVAEVDHQDRWQRATLIAALTGGSMTRLAASVDNVQRWLEARCPDGVRLERVLASVEDLHDLIPAFGREG